MQNAQTQSCCSSSGTTYDDLLDVSSEPACVDNLLVQMSNLQVRNAVAQPFDTLVPIAMMG